MATSGDTTFDQTRDQLIDDALAGLGAIGPGESAAGAMRDHAARALDRVAKSIDADGRFMWRLVRRTVAMVASTASYTIGTDVIDILEPASYRGPGAPPPPGRTPITLMSMEDYMRITDRTVTGRPSRVLLEKVLPTTRTLTFWPVPNEAGQVEYVARTRAQDYDTGAQTGDFPARYAKALILGLMTELAPAYGQSMEKFAVAYRDELDRQNKASMERTPLRLVPFGGFGRTA